MASHAEGPSGSSATFAVSAPADPSVEAMAVTTTATEEATATTLRPAPATSTRSQRPSRRGAPRKFRCEVENCGRVYTRAEHLQRHQLNHNPRDIFECDEEGCSHSFVRIDLLARHKSRHHSGSYLPRNPNRTRSFSTPTSNSTTAEAGSVINTTPENDTALSLRSPPTINGLSRQQRSGTNGQPSPRMPHDAAILLTPEPAPTKPLTPVPDASSSSRLGPWSPTTIDGNMLSLKPMYFEPEAQGMTEQSASVIPWSFPSDEALNRDSFAVWLFDNQGNHGDFDVANIPFLEGGLESSFNAHTSYDRESLTSPSTSEAPLRYSECDDLLSEYRRQEILRWFESFRRRYPKLEPLVVNLVSLNPPALSLDMLRNCLREFWAHIACRMPIIHQPTFSCNRSSILLLLAMIALGAASIRNRDSSGALVGYGGFADVIISGLRWEIMTAEEATPPVSLSVAQALLLLEFHEKLYSSRKLHERSHIYHSSTLTLLRRGSPLIGRSGSESPPEHQVCPNHASNPALDSRTRWIKWAETEAMHRVVYAAFMGDILHAAMFGHTADMAPHEIRLPLPCDDQLWTASTPDEMREKDANLRMYGVKPIAFLDGLKRAVHGKEVQTHSFGRMIIMSGLLSVGWHLSRRDTHLKWLDLAGPGGGETRDGWRKTLVAAFDEWKVSFDSANDGLLESSVLLLTTSNFQPLACNDGGGRQQIDANNGPIQNASVLYHLAHISLHVDIVDCQVYSGARQLLGRKVSTRDRSNVVARMKTWAGLPATKHAILHAFKLLHRVLVDPRARAASTGLNCGGGETSNRLPPIKIATYSCRSEPDPHRPWIMYYATLSIWAFVRALRSRRPRASHQEQQQQGSTTEGLCPLTPISPTSTTGFNPVANYNNVVAYLSSVSRLHELDDASAAGLAAGLPDLLDCMHGILGDAHSELLREARERLVACKAEILQ